MKIKIALYIDNMQRGGAQRVMKNLAEFYSRRGNEVILINDIMCKDKLQEYEISVDVRREYLETTPSVGLKKNIVRILNLRKILKKEDPKFVLSFMGPPNIRLLLATIGLKINKYVSVRNDPTKEYGTGIKRIVVNTLFLLADGYIFQTYDASKYFFKSIQNRSRIIFNPVDQKFYNAASKKKEPEKIVAFIGRLQPQKNPQLAIKAFSKVAYHFPQHKLVFYGEGELKSELIKMAKEYGIVHQVEFAGQTDIVEEKLSKSEVFLMTSDYEGMPNALMEAMAVGVPCISTDCPCGGPRSLISDDTQGMLFPCGDEDALSELMFRLISSRSLRKKIGDNAMIRAKEFKPEIIFGQWLDYLM